MDDNQLDLDRSFSSIEKEDDAEKKIVYKDHTLNNDAQPNKSVSSLKKKG